MRFEAKHRISKIAARASFDRRNITLTLATKHQLQLNDIFVKGSLSSCISFGVSKRISKQDRNEIIQHLNLDKTLSFVPISWARVKGTLYKTGTIISKDISGNFGDISFVHINTVYKYNENRIIFECTPLLTIDFDYHLYCFEVQKSKDAQKIYVCQDSLISYIPNHVNIASNGKMYVTQRTQNY